jgi:hypothetical protein
MQQTDATNPGIDHIIYVLLGDVQLVQLPVSQRVQTAWSTVTAEILGRASPFSIILLLRGCPISQSLETNPEVSTQQPPKL